MRSTKTFLVIVATFVCSLSLLTSCDLVNGILGSETDDYEPNDSLSAAHPIDLDQGYTAYIAENDADFFSFRPAHGADTYDEVEISITDSGPDLRIGLALYDPQGDRFASQTVSTKGANLTFVLRTPGLPSGDNFTVRFSGTWGVGGWEVGGIGDYDTQGPYTFRIRNLNANDVFAPNHSIASAHSITVGESYDGVLVSRYEADYFSFTPTSSDNMALIVTDTDAALYLGVAWYGKNGNYIGRDTFETNGETGTITITGLTADEAHYLRFSGTDGWPSWEIAGVGDYQSRGAYTFLVDAY